MKPDLDKLADAACDAADNPGAKAYTFCRNLARAVAEAVIADDEFAAKVAIDCHDPQGHDPRWCPTCAARSDGIEDYREALKRDLLGPQEQQT